ncbi:MAG: hypothetical protein KKI07_00575 [Euryarchaeota archaeon]|nr:hypothetical protein [Euryarchaeota archaeon]
MRIFDYIDDDPLVQITISNPRNKIEKRTLAYADTGSTVLAIPKDIWDYLGLEYTESTMVGTVHGLDWAWIDWVDVEFIDNFELVPVILSKDPEVILGRFILDKFVVTFDGRTKKLKVED